MENNQELFKQAILDARALRDTALVQAKTALAEHFEPTIKSMMRKQLSEDMEQEGMYDEMHNMGNDDSSEHKNLRHDLKSEGYDGELEEILAELDEMTADLEENAHVEEDGMDPFKETSGNTDVFEKFKVSHGDRELHEGEDTESDHKNDTEEPEEDDDTEGGDYDMEDDGTEGEEGKPEDSEELVDITVGDLKDIIRDVFSQMQHGEPDGDELPGDDEEHYDDDNEIPASDEPEGDMDEISLEEILAELELEEAQMNEEEHDEIPGGSGKREPRAENPHEVNYESMEKELNEAIKTIKIMKKELNETNLFNAKLLYVNKIFKAKSLNEVQKTKVINAFDRATSVKEVENINKTLLESLSDFTPATKKSSLKESVGFASKPIGNAPARPIVEADAFVSRWQQLAGIKK